MIEFTLIETENLILRKIDIEVMNSIFESYSDDELMTFFGLSKTEELEKEKFRYENGLTTFNRSFLYFHLIDKTSNKVIGWCGYHTWAIDHDRAEMGYGLYADKWKQKGLMTEAMNVIIPYGFKEMKLHRIEALIGLENIASFKVLDKFGFQKEGELREHYLVDGKYEDSLMYSLLVTD
jgi:ribosomal-protein-alanine N-acetyltransferase